MGGFLKRHGAQIFVIGVFVLLLLFYTAYDKQSKTLQFGKLSDVITFKNSDSSLRELNKVAALAAIGLISCAFILGPLSRLFPAIFGKFLTWRKFIGLSGFALALLHSVYSLVEFYDLDIGKMLSSNPKALGFISAIVAFLILLSMTVTSTKEAVKKMGYEKWKKVQTFGYAGLFFAILHFVVLETKPDIGLDVRPFGILFLLIAMVALVLRIGMIFIKSPERTKFEEHVGEEILEESEAENYIDKK